MTSLRERRHREVNNTIDRLWAQRDAIVANLVRVETKLRQAVKTRRRLEQAMAKPVTSKTAQPSSDARKPTLTESCDAIVSGMLQGQTFKQASDDIPDFLKRESGEGDRKDAEARAQILAEQEDRKRKKARGRIEKMKSNKSGDRKKMPLTGKAALAAIYGN